MRCAGPSRFAAPAIVGKSDAPTLMGQGASASSYDPDIGHQYTPEQVAAAEVGNKSPHTPSADVNASIRTVMLYRWAWSTKKSDGQMLGYSHDGCS
eukprot:10915507-Heterocapsa_arctica.AAC.1